MTAWVPRFAKASRCRHLISSNMVCAERELLPRSRLMLKRRLSCQPRGALGSSVTPSPLVSLEGPFALVDASVFLRSSLLTWDIVFASGILANATIAPIEAPYETCCGAPTDS
jgi:hypothetical protein